MRARSMIKIACIFALVALTPSPAFAAHVVQNSGGEQGTSQLELEVQASLRELNDIMQSLSPNAGGARRLNQEDPESLENFGDLIQSVVNSFQSAGIGSGSIGSNLFRGGNSNLFGATRGGEDGNSLSIESITDFLDSDTPFTTGATLLDTKNATVPASLDTMLKTTGLTAEESAALGITAASFFLTSAICFTVFGGLAIGAFSGLLFTAGLGLITGPYGWGVSVRQTWNTVLSSRSSIGENTKLWTSTLTRTAERINNLNTGALKQELAGLRGQLGDVLNLVEAARSRFM